MVECLDANIGKVTDYLASIGELDNTYITFLSDNGAEGAAYEAYPMVQGPLMEHLRNHYNNHIDNIGAFDSFVWYGPRWAQAATAPSRLYKAYTTEGGVRVPAVTRFPPLIYSSTGTLQPGSITDAFSTVMDLAPTFLELAGVQHPTTRNALFKGRQVVPMRGASLVPLLSGSAPTVHPVDHVTGWELCGRGAIRSGPWKAVFLPPPKGTGAWQLYNLVKDPGETEDLAEKSEEGKTKLEELLAHWEKYVEECGVVPLQPELGTYVLAMEEQMVENAWMEYEYWKPGALEKRTREGFFRDPPKFGRDFGKEG